MIWVREIFTQWRVARLAHALIFFGLLGLMQGIVTGASSLLWPSPWGWVVLAGAAAIAHALAVWRMDLASRSAALFLSFVAVTMRGLGFLAFPTSGQFNGAAVGSYVISAAAICLLWNQRRHATGDPLVRPS